MIDREEYWLEFKRDLCEAIVQNTKIGDANVADTLEFANRDSYISPGACAVAEDLGFSAQQADEIMQVCLRLAAPDALPVESRRDPIASTMAVGAFFGFMAATRVGQEWTEQKQRSESESADQLFSPEEAEALFACYSGGDVDAEMLNQLTPKLEAIAGRELAA